MSDQTAIKGYLSAYGAPIPVCGNPHPFTVDSTVTAGYTNSYLTFHNQSLLYLEDARYSGRSYIGERQAMLKQGSI